MTKKLFVTVFLLVLCSVFSGCSIRNSENSNKNTPENQWLARIEVYSANEKNLINTIEDKEILTTFNENILCSGQWDDMGEDYDYIKQQAEIQKKLEKYEPQYIFIAHKTPVAIINDGSLEKVLEVTVYKDTNIVKVQISPDNVKNFLVPSEYLTFYFEASDEAIAYLYSLT